MPVYDVTTHPLRSDAARSLYASSPTGFESVAAEAERTLGLEGTSFSGADAEAAKFAVVRQVNHMLAMDADYVLHSMTVRGSRTKVARAGSIQTVDPLARQTVERLGIGQTADATFAVIRSLR